MTFEAFYFMYPRKIGKRAAEKSWNRLTKDEQQEALAALPNHLAYWKFKQTEKDYICHPATWLNQGRWEDELEFEKAKKPELPWYSTNDLTLKKAAEVGVNPYAGEDWPQLRARISAQMKRLEEQM
jgi:hypothetical protein